MFAEMTQNESIPDDVPVADAIEQMRPAAETAILETVDAAEKVQISDGVERSGAPLEVDESDWQEQHLVIEDPEDDR